MAIARWVASALALVAMSPATGLAQPNVNFKDSWFWGVKGGVISFATATVDGRVEPVVGGEWLLTRTQGGLYVSFDQSLFDASSALEDTTGQSHTVRIRDMRRLTVAAMAFPLFFDAGFASIRPYAGAGFALNFIRSAALTGAPPADTILQKDVNNRLEEERDRAAPVLILAADAGGSEVLPQRPSDRVRRGGVALQRGQLQVATGLKGRGAEGAGAQGAASGSNCAVKCRRNGASSTMRKPRTPWRRRHTSMIASTT